MKWVIFDLDGTLSRTDRFIVPSIQAAMKEMNMEEWTIDEIRITIGERVEETNLKLFGQESCVQADIFWRRVSYYQDHVYKGMEVVYEGTSELLDGLHNKGYQTAVCSNADQSYIEMMLERLGLQDKIDRIRPVISGKDKVDSLAALLGEINPEAAVMVGDRIYDVVAAKANQIPSIGCLYGCGTLEELEEASGIANHPAEIGRLVDELLETGKE